MIRGGINPADRERVAKLERLSLYKPLSQEIQPAAAPTIESGLSPLDDTLGGGFAQGLHMLIGFAHAGKSLLVEQMVSANHHKRIVMLSPDETVGMIMSKLAERAGVDPKAPVEELRSFAGEHYPRLAISDVAYSTDRLTAYLEEYVYVHEGIDLITYDYLDLLRGPQVGDDVRSKGEFLKALAKTHDCPLICIHQGSRSKAADGQPLTMTSGAYGGEQAAFTVIGVYQRAFDPELSPSEREFYRNHPTMTVQVLKNKQRRRGGLDQEGTDYRIEPDGSLVEPELADEISPSPMSISNQRSQINYLAHPGLKEMQ